MSASRRSAGTASAMVLGCAAAVLLLVLLDAAEMLARRPGELPRTGLLGFVAVGWALGTALAVPLMLARGWIASRLRAWGELGVVLVGTCDGALLFTLAVVGHDPRWPAGNVRAFVLLGAAVGMATHGWLIGRLHARTWARRGGTLLVIVAALMMLHGIRWNGDDWIRLAIHAVVVASIAWLVVDVLAARAARSAALAVCAVAALLAFAATPILHRAAATRGLLYARSSHVRAWAYAIEALLDRDGDGAANVLGGSDCDAGNRGVFPGATELPGNGREDNCEGGDGTASTPDAPVADTRTARGAARGSDILMLSLDALRWDTLDALAELRTALGPHATFTRAVTPAPATRESLAAIMRGRPAQQLRFETVSNVRGPVLWRDHSPTLAHRLVRAGYRTAVVPLTDVLDPRAGVAAGFETVLVANFDARRTPPPRPPHAQSHVRAETGIPMLLNLARETPGPLCAWAHFIETHAPYRWGQDGAGPPTLEGLRRAARDLTSRLSALLREWEAIRGRAPIVVVFSDHGEEFGEHGGLNHASSVHAEQARVVFLLRAPGVPQGVFDAPVSTASIPATLLDLLGLDAPTTMTEPTLLAPLTTGASWPTVAVTQLRAPGHRTWTGYTTDPYRLVRDPVHDVDQLYDARSDPLEQHDLARSHPDVLARMKTLAQRWDESH